MDDLTLLKVNLIPKAVEALETAAILMGDTKTDTVNRALQVYWAIADAAERAEPTSTFQLTWKRADGREVGVIVQPPPRRRPWWWWWPS